MKRKFLEEGIGDVYYGASCLTRYWIRDNEKECIVHREISKTGQGSKLFGEEYPWNGEYLDLLKAQEERLNEGIKKREALLTKAS